jgi:hypothetical protein
LVRACSILQNFLSPVRFESKRVNLIDVDRFKKFNDHFGHTIGNQIFIEIARRLTWPRNFLMPGVAKSSHLVRVCTQQSCGIEGNGCQPFGSCQNRAIAFCAGCRALIFFIDFCMCPPLPRYALNRGFCQTKAPSVEALFLRSPTEVFWARVCSAGLSRVVIASRPRGTWAWRSNRHSLLESHRCNHGLGRARGAVASCRRLCHRAWARRRTSACRRHISRT